MEFEQKSKNADTVNTERNSVIADCDVAGMKIRDCEWVGRDDRVVGEDFPKEVAGHDLGLRSSRNEWGHCARKQGQQAPRPWGRSAADRASTGAVTKLGC